MNLEFLFFLTSDRLKLPALLYTPQKPTKKAAVWLHGMGDNGSFYNPELMNTIASHLTAQTIAFFAFNNRGAHNRKHIKIMDETLPEDERTFIGGTHYEKISDCVLDIDGAATILRQKGYTELYLIGHSTGANKICAYDFIKNDTPFYKYVLSGPGDDSGLFYNELGEKRFLSALSYARRYLRMQQPYKIMPKYSGMYPFSAQAAYDIMDPDGSYNTFPYFEATTKKLGKKPLFQEYRRMTKPILVIYGEQDEYTYTAGGTRAAMTLLKDHTAKSARKHSAFMTIKGADHSFRGFEESYASTIAQWLAK